MDPLATGGAQTTVTPQRRRVPYTGTQLGEVDLRRFNEGQNPYPGDQTIDLLFKIRSLEFYREYIERTQFTGAKKVLDLGCGIGHWSLFLAERNEYVVGIDRVGNCIRLASNMAQSFSFDNVSFLKGDISLTKQFKAEEFDCVWLWSVMNYIPRGEVLAETYRILKPGGKVFIGMYGSTGRMLEHVVNGFHSGSGDSNAQWALTALQKGPADNGVPNYGTLETAAELCDMFGFSLIKACAQGAIDLRVQGGMSERPITEKSFNFFVRDMELIARK